MNVLLANKWVKRITVLGAAFAFGFILGALAGIADPSGGWAPWRVGLLAGVIVVGVVAFFGVLMLTIEEDW